MKFKHMVLKYIDFQHEMSENEREKKLFPFFQRLDLNLGPHDPQSNALSVRPQRQRKLETEIDSYH